MRKHVEKLLQHQRDILTPKAIAEVEAAIADLQAATESDADTATIDKRVENLEKVANQWLKPYPNATYRENVEVFLVALAVAMGIRTFFLQPFKIPTGSMQPTLFGVTSEPDFTRIRTQADAVEQLKLRDNLVFPTGWERAKEWFEGISYLRVVSKTDGELQAVEAPLRILIFNIKQTIWIGGVAHTIWFPPDFGEARLDQRAALKTRAQYGEGQFFHKGDEVVRIKVQAGDHLFVDRLTYNFRPPKRGEIIVFETKGIPEEMRDRFRIPADQFYIKRLVGLGGERIQIGDDQHLVIDGKRLDSSTPHFENVYGFNPKDAPQDSHYSGHVKNSFLAPYFEDQPDGVNISPAHYLVMGDNTMNSLDSRAWGEFPSSSVIGKSFFVYWPITRRFGWGQQ